MTTRAAARSKNKKPLETTLGKAPFSSTDDPIDLSHIRKPIDTSIFGLSQVLTLFETATDEVRRYITYECDIIYECRMCRTIFRSLANFILHKRSYCRESYNSSDHTNCRNSCQENQFYVFQEEADAIANDFKDKQNSHEGSPVPQKCDSKPKQMAEVIQPETDCVLPGSKDKKNLRSVLCRLLNKQESTLITEQCLAEDISNESESPEKEEVKNNVTLQAIGESGPGVFQTMFRNMIQEHSKMDFMKTEVMEIHDILENNEAILGSDGKIITSGDGKSEVLKNNFICTVCNQKFSTKKTLAYHINYKHNNTRQVYQCPECKDMFANTWGVFRHLYKIHRKTPAQVKRLRNQIHANKIRKDEQPEQKNANNLKVHSASTTNSQGRLNLENQRWMDDLEGDNDLQRCGGCGRKFERKAALHSHSQFCTKRIAVCNSIKENSAKRLQTDEKTEKVKNSKAAATNVENGTSSTRRRKPLIAHRLCRIDYFKENQQVKQVSKSTLIPVAPVVVDDDQTIKSETAKKGDDRETNHITENDNAQGEDHPKIEEVESIIGIVKVNSNPDSASLSEPNINSNDERCGNSNNKFNVNKLDMNPIMAGTGIEEADASETKQLDSTNNCSAALKNSIVTRSKSNVVLQLEESGFVPTNEADHVTETVSDVTEAVSKPSSSIEFVENIGMTLHDITCEKLVNIIQADSKIEVMVNESTSDMKPSSDTDNAPQKNTVQIECFDTQREIIEDGKRKVSDSMIDPQPENSKRKKIENSLEVFSKGMKEVTAGNNPKIKNNVTLETKSLKYIDKEKQLCLPCKKVFKSYKSLIKHMALHFNWYRYQCRSCQFMSYNRSKCDRHAEKNHGAHNEATLKNFVLHIPVWKTAEISTDFVQCCKKHRMQVDKMHTLESTVQICPKKETEVTKVQNDSNLVSVPEEPKVENCPAVIEDDKSKLDAPDRKTIMEVIWGSNIGSVSQPEVHRSPEKQDCRLQLKHETNTLSAANEMQKCADNRPAIEDPVVLRDNARPVRNRTAPVHKDFLYDMKQILKPKSMKDSATDSNKGGALKKPASKTPEKTKSKFKKSTQVIPSKEDETNRNKIVSGISQPCAAIDLSQDINMNCNDLTKKHITGDC